MGFYAPHSRVEQAKRDGVRVLGIRVEKSHYDCVLEWYDGEWALRLGMRLVRGLKAEQARKLVRERERSGYSYQSPESFLKLGGLSQADWLCLARANGFLGFGWTRRQTIWKIRGILPDTLLRQPEKDPSWKNERPDEALSLDFKANQVSVQEHPTQVILRSNWQWQLKRDKLLSCQQLGAIRAGSWVDVFGLVIVRQSPPTAKGMLFITLEDRDGFFNLVFTPQVYRNLPKIFMEESFLCVGGRLQKQGEAHSVMVQRIYPKVDVQAPVRKIHEKGQVPSGQFIFEGRDFR